LRRKPQLENFRLILEPLVFLAGVEKTCDTGNINLLASLELADLLRQQTACLGYFRELVCRLELCLLLLPQPTPAEMVECRSRII
jgi:hypothetical protein